MKERREGKRIEGREEGGKKGRWEEAGNFNKSNFSGIVEVEY